MGQRRQGREREERGTGVEGCMGKERVREKGKGEGDVEGRMTKQNGKGEEEKRWG